MTIVPIGQVQEPPPDELELSESLPHDLAAEQSIISTALFAPESTLRAVGVLNPADMYQPAHGIVWGAITALHEGGGQVDPITVADHLRRQADPVTRRSLLDLAGGETAIISLATGAYTAGLPSDAGAWAEIVRRHAASRRILDTAARIRQQARAGSDPRVVLDDAREALGRIEAPTSTPVVDMVSTMEQTLAAIERKETAGLATPWPDLNRVIGGLRGGTLTVIGARPGVGKSMLALNLAEHMADQHGLPVLFCSLEMLAAEIGLRRLACATGILMSTLQHGALSGAQTDQVQAAAGQLMGSPLMLLDDAGQTASSIRAVARELHRNQPLGLIVVDYLQLLTPERREPNREREVAEQSRRFKLLAQELGVPVVVLSQLNRSLVGRSDKRPELTDLRESGAIEQDADVVWLLDLPDAEDKTSLRLAVAKNRNGGTEDVWLRRQGWLARVTSATRGRQYRYESEDSGS